MLNFLFVFGQNQAPVAVNDSFELQVGMPGVVLNVLQNDYDPEGDPIKIAEVNRIGFGTTSSFNDSSILVGTMPLLYEHIYEYRIQEINDSTSISNWATVYFNPYIDINAPIAINDTVIGFPGTSIYVNVLKNDYDPNGDSIYIFSSGGRGEIVSDSIIMIDFPMDNIEYDEYNNGYLKMAYIIADTTPWQESWDQGLLFIKLDHINSFDNLNINNINARLNCFGNHFWDMPGGIGAHYEYPKGSGHHSMFNFALWLGGMDENDQLKVAAERYRQSGTDYWTGPLSSDDNNVWIDTNIVGQWFNIWKLNKDEVEYHVLHWYEPGYEPIDNILNWPAHGDVEIGQNFYLAPFIDVNSDSIYEPLQGDYPLIRGDQTLFFIFNDQLEHTETGGQAIGIEVHGFAYAFNDPDKLELHNTTFLSYKIFNRSQHTLTETYAGLFSDIDLGFAWDDFIGCDVARGAYYAYNGDTIDGNGQPEAYGANPPAQGIIVLGGPYMDPDGIDNPTGGCDESINGVGFGDGIADNERFGMNNFIYFNNGGAQYQSDPNSDYEYYNYLKGIWRDSTVMEYGGNGHVSSGAYGPAAKFMFPGLSDPCDWGTGGIPPYGPVEWTEETAGNEPFDRRGLCSMGPFTLEAGGFHKIDIAFVTARGDSLINSVDLLMSYIDSVKTYYFQDPDHFGYQYLGEKEKMPEVKKITIYPNPANSITYINYTPATNAARYIIYDNFGRKVTSGILNNSNIHKIDISNFEKGLYIFRVIDGTNQITCKLLKK